MFTGLIEDIGRLGRIDRRGQGGSLVVETSLPLAEIRIGDSIAVSGACLTVTAKGGGWFSVDFSRETAARTALADLSPGASLHLERAMRLSDRLDGHLVMGHVDGVGKIASSASVGDSWLLTVSCPAEVQRYLVPKGSVAVHGVSLTVNEVMDGAFALTIVPLTQTRTFLTRLPVGSPVNLEADMLAKYVERLLGPATGRAPREGLSMETLLSSGFGR